MITSRAHRLITRSIILLAVLMSGACLPAAEIDQAVVDQAVAELQQRNRRARVAALQLYMQKLDRPHQQAVAHHVAGSDDPLVGTWATFTRQTVTLTPEAVRRWADTRNGRTALAPWLARQQDPEQWRLILAWLRSSEVALNRAALAAAITAGIGNKHQMQRIARHITNDDAAARSLAAECYRRFGIDDDVEMLEQRLSDEAHPVVCGALRAAIIAAHHRSEIPTIDVAAWRSPHWKFAGRETADQTAARAHRSAMLEALQLPRSPASDTSSGLVCHPTITDAPRAGPYGGEGVGPFAGRTHVAVDMAWNGDLQPIVSPAAGIVRYARAEVPSWGGLVVIEHRDPDGTVWCSLSGHLDRVLAVREGDVVAGGTQIGALGMSYTWSNGGYQAHLHFGIHMGPYGDGRWVAGYIDPNRSDHGWVHPVAFLQERGAGPLVD